LFETEVSIRSKARVRDEEMSVMENNGQVTLPNFSRFGSRLTKRQLRCALFVSAIFLTLFRSRR
jgi:hypothetical protein